MGFTLEAIHELKEKADRWCIDCVNDCYECQLKNFINRLAEHVTLAEVGMNEITNRLVNKYEGKLMARIEQKMINKLCADIFPEAIKWAERESKVIRLSPEEMQIRDAKRRMEESEEEHRR